MIVRVGKSGIRKPRMLILIADGLTPITAFY